MILFIFYYEKNLKIKSVATLMETLGNQNEGKKGKKGSLNFIVINVILDAVRNMDGKDI